MGRGIAVAPLCFILSPSRLSQRPSVIPSPSPASELPAFKLRAREFLYCFMFQTVEVAAGGALLEEIKPTDMFPGYRLECYPNRDSTAYGELYDITTASTILRGTLRYEVPCT